MLPEARGTGDLASAAGAGPDAVSLYIHIPFCQVRCHYCDFATFVGREDRRDEYIDALLAELDGYGPGRLAATTVFLGGGTPSLLEGQQMARLLAGVRARVALLPGAEISCECNPGTVDEAKLAAYRVAGINRLSFGAQTFDAQVLARLGRLHGVAEIGEAVAAARAAGCDNLNLDLIFGLPGQDAASWEATLAAALALAPEHVSAYGLTVEPNTRFGQLQREGQLGPLPDEDAAAEMLATTGERLTAAGYGHYEIANFARPGREARHNLTYWRNRPYVGIGLGAHSYYRRRRYANPAGFDAYLAGPVDHRRAPAQPAREEMEETAFLGLRLLDEGLSRAGFRARFGRELDEVYGAALAGLIATGLLADDGARVRLTAAAVPVANGVFERFLIGS